MTRDERQLIRMMNKSFNTKGNSRAIKINDLSEKKSSEFGLDDETNSDCDQCPASNHYLNTDWLNLFNSHRSPSPDSVFTINTGEDKKRGHNDVEPSDVVEEPKKYDLDEPKTLCQHFVLENPWLPYEDDCRLTKFVVGNDKDVDLEFEILFKRPPHLMHKPSDLNDPLSVIRRFKKLVDEPDESKSSTIKCYVLYCYDDEFASKDNAFLSYKIEGKITAMEVTQYRFGLKITVKGKITN